MAILGYVFADAKPRPSGGSWYGYLSGAIGTLLILWLTMLGVRKRAFTSGRWSLKGWVSAHVYLGLCLVVIATLHTGFQFGWNVHTLAYALMVGVVGSGVVGVLAYSTLPRRMSDNRGGLTEAQMLARLREFDARLAEAARGFGAGDAAAVRMSINETRLGGGILQRLGVGTDHCGNRRALAALAKPGAGGDDLALTLVVSLLEEKAAALRQTRRHIRLRALLDLWLRVHVPLTFALLAALAAHIVSVFFYW